MAKTNTTGISITHVARDDIRRYAATATGALGRRVTLTDALRLAVSIAAAHPDDVQLHAERLGLTQEDS